MVTLSSHLLNSVDGTHASGVEIIIYQINSSGGKKIFFEGPMLKKLKEWTNAVSNRVASAA